MKISVVNHSQGVIKCWIATIEGRPEIRGGGETFDAAVGNLLRSHLQLQVSLGIDIVDETSANKKAD